MTPATVPVTFFANHAASTKREDQISPQKLAVMISEMVSSEKVRLPWLKLAKFGFVRTPKNSLRHDGNVLCITGIEGDYDLEKIAFETTVEIARKAGLLCLIYTSPSHAPHAPRWRILCFLSRELPPTEHYKLVARLNGLYGGIFSTESFTLSQSYYYGRVVGGKNHRVEVIDGTPIDLLDNLDEGAIGKPNGSSGPSDDGTFNARGPFDEAAIAAEIISGTRYHSACLQLLGRWAYEGVAFLDALHRLYAIFEQVPEAERNQRWRIRYDDVWRCAADVYGAEARKADDAAEAAATAAPGSRPVTATPFVLTDPAALPRREFLYARHLIRRYISTTVAPGASGKSSLIVTEALAMVTGRPLLGEAIPASPLRVWHINLEDPEDELKRRIAAAAIHFGIRHEDIEDRLFLDSGRRVDIVIAKDARDGIELAVPVIEALKAEIIEKRIDVLQIDPFVSCHAVEENSNTKIAAVVRQWAMIAEETNCAIELVHHVRKPNGGGRGQGFTVDDARGAVALIAAVRSARVLNAMSNEQAEAANISNPFAYFYIGNGKANLAPRDNKAKWCHLVGVPLGNGTGLLDPGDTVAAVEPWKWPDPFAEVGLEDAKEVQRRIAGGQWRENSRSTSWAGLAVAEVLGLDPTDKAVKAQVRTLLAAWLATGALRVVKRKDEKRMDRWFIEVGQWLT